MTGSSALLTRISSPVLGVDIWNVGTDDSAGPVTSFNTDSLFRTVLSKYLRVTPENVDIIRENAGKPCLGASSALHFNFTDSRSIALMAVSMDRQVGIDVEQIRLRVDLDALIDKVATPVEQGHLLASTGSVRSRLFNRYWVRKEAYLKAIGTGLTFPMNRVDVSLSFRQRQGTVTAPTVDGRRVAWTIYDVLLPETKGLAVASLAVEGFFSEPAILMDVGLSEHVHPADLYLSDGSIQ
jgi:4'-phosphopantetheinyl transferase